MNTANKLTILRVFMIPVFLLVLYLDVPNANYWALAIFVIASLTDTLDGQAEKQVPGQQNPGVQGGDHSVVVAVGVLQHLIAKEVHGEFVQDALREFGSQFFHSSQAS